MKWFTKLFEKKQITEDEKLFKRHQGWIFFLTIGWLLGTFQHNYAALSKYHHNEMWSLGWLFSGLEIPIAAISIFVIVLVLEAGLFWSIMFIPAGKNWNVKPRVMYMILSASTAISMFLNIKYMVEASPSPSVMDIGVGAVVGGIIPLMVVMLGYVEGNIVTSRIQRTTSPSGDVTVSMVREALQRNPGMTQRAAAAKFDVSLGKMNKIFAQIRESGDE
jgi:hypothetical protein